MIEARETMQATPQPETDTAPLELSRPRAQRKRAHVPANQDADEHLYLIGRPTLKQFLRFAKNQAVGAPDDGTLTDEWQAASDVLKSLEKEEAGAADNPTITPLELNSKTEPLLTDFLKDPLVQNGFNTVPTDVALVELDRLVVFQHHIDLTYARMLERELPTPLTEEQIFRTALAHDHPRTEVKWSRVRGNTFVFMSRSNDMRFLGTMKLKPENITDYPHPGDLAGVIGVAVGFGSNFLNAIYCENRLILYNGSHRAYTLRKMGITHVPCIIQHASNREKLDVLAGSEIMDRPDYYLKHPRPSMLKDYFNPKLHKVFSVRRQLKQVTIKIEVDDGYVPAL